MIDNSLNILIDCDLCEISCGNIYTKEKENIKICCSCASNIKDQNSDIFTSFDDVIIKNNVDCPICLDIKKGIKLPNCNHFCCISCFKKIYFGYTDIPKPIEPENYHDDPYLKMFPTFGEEYHYYISWMELYDDCDNEYADYKDSVLNLRLPWMNTPEFFAWEKEKDDWELEELNHDTLIDEYYDSKYSKRNPYCPLCRK